MPFCTQCGNVVQPLDTFCGSCGARQADAGTGSSAPKPDATASGFAAGAQAGSQKAQEFLDGVTPRNASLLCYIPVVGWIMSIVVLASERFRQDRIVRFHAFQGLYLFVIWLFVDWVFGPMTHRVEGMRSVDNILKAAVFGAWIFMIVKTNQGENFHLPILGELAERSVSEQK